MAFITVPMDKGKEQTVAPEGEYEMVVRKVITDKPSKAGKPMIRCLMAFVGRPDLSPFTHFINLPVPEDSEDMVAARVRDVRRFCSAFNVPVHDNGFDSDDLPGASGWCRVSVETVERGSGETFESNRLLLPRVKEE